MGWMLITAAVFAGALVLVGALYAARGNKCNRTSQLPPEDAGVSDQAEGGDE